MAVLYVTEQGAWIRKTGDRLVVEKKGERLLDVPCLKIETVLLYGNVQFTTQALAKMLAHGIELALFSLSGRLKGQLTPPKAKNIVLRMSQFERARSPEFCLSLAKEIVAAKVESSVAVLRRYRANHPEAFPAAEVEALERVLPQIPAAASLDSLRGLEGTAAARYFPLLARMVPPGLRPARRERRPPPDPFNALLSFGYVLVGNELQALLDGMGYDPYLGYLHQVDYGRPSLALDLLEEFRPSLVDRFSASLLNLRVLQSHDFVTMRQGGVRLNRDGLAKYFRAWEEELAQPVALADGAIGFRQIFRRQAEHLARAVRGEEPYRAFRLPC